MRPLYILSRTSGRPQFFKRMRESVAALTWPGGVVHVVHADDPRCESYIDCDILIKGEYHGDYMGDAPYNLYNNRLLKIPPAGAWVAFIDDDDEYTAPDVFEQIINNPDADMFVNKAQRWNDTIWPRHWLTQKSFQTECFVLDSLLAKSGKWWGDRGGDHYYTKQIVRKASKIVWRDVLACKAQEGKGHGKLVDIGGNEWNWDSLPPHEMVHVKMYRGGHGRHAAKLYQMSFAEAREIEKQGLGRVTYKGEENVFKSNQ